MTQASWLDVVCPICAAQERKPCTAPSGAVLPHPHAARVKAAEAATAPPAQPAPPPATPLYGYTTNGDTPHLVSAGDRNRSVCGYKLNWIPDIQPNNPVVCKTCTRLTATFGAAYQPPAPEGVCQVCGAEERLDSGLIAPHKQLVVGATGLRRSDVDCPGAGEAAEVTS